MSMGFGVLVAARGHKDVNAVEWLKLHLFAVPLAAQT